MCVCACVREGGGWGERKQEREGEQEWEKERERDDVCNQKYGCIHVYICIHVINMCTYAWLYMNSAPTSTMLPTCATCMCVCMYKHLSLKKYNYIHTVNICKLINDIYVFTVSIHCIHVYIYPHTSIHTPAREVICDRKTSDKIST